MSDCMSRTGIVGGTTDRSHVPATSRSFCLFLGLAIPAMDFVIMKCRLIDGERPGVFFFSAYHYHIP